MPNLFPGYVGSVDVQHQRETIWLHAAVCRAVTTSHRDPRVEATEISVSGRAVRQHSWKLAELSRAASGTTGV